MLLLLWYILGGRESEVQEPRSAPIVLIGMIFLIFFIFERKKGEKIGSNTDTVLKRGTWRVCITFIAVTVVTMAADCLPNAESLLCIGYMVGHFHAGDRGQDSIYFFEV